MEPTDKPRTRSRSPGHSSRRRDRDDAGQISQEDYFRLNAPFRLWLRKEKDRYFDEMSSDKAHRYFKSFVRAWNKGELRSKYYKQDGELSNLSKTVVTRHNWAFASKVDQKALDSVKDDIRRSTHTSNLETPAVKAPGQQGTRTRDTETKRDTETERVASEERWEERRAQRKQERRRARDREEQILDEVAPKETGREAQLMKKRALHQARHTKQSLDVDIPDSEMYANSTDSLNHLKRERDTREQRKQEYQARRDAGGRGERLKEHAEKEQRTIEALKAMAEQSRAQGLGMSQKWTQ
ncbi:hypothetical protein IW147_000140 [Coemansia sp. RSA 720]|nr:hypothetical protein IW147_000140 [Coemansia sp. RSA 720]